DKITDAQRDSLMGLRADAVSYRKIADAWNVAPSAVHKAAAKMGIAGLTPLQVQQVIDDRHTGSLTEADLAVIEEAFPSADAKSDYDAWTETVPPREDDGADDPVTMS